jgi:membrane protein
VAWVAIGALLSGGVAALYRFAPDRDDPKWRWVSPGAAFVTWIAFPIGLQIYAASCGSYDAT